MGQDTHVWVRTPRYGSGPPCVGQAGRAGDVWGGAPTEDDHIAADARRAVEADRGRSGAAVPQPQSAPMAPPDVERIRGVHARTEPGGGGDPIGNT